MYYLDFSGKQSEANNIMADYFMSLSEAATDRAAAYQFKTLADNARSALYELVIETLLELPKGVQSAVPVEFHALFDATQAYIQSGDDNQAEIDRLDKAYDAVVALNAGKKAAKA